MPCGCSGAAVLCGDGVNVVTLPPKNREREIERIVMLCNTFQPGKAVNVKFTIARPERTIPQVAYLHAVCYTMLSEHTGYEKEEIEEYLLGSYFGWKEKKLPGGRVSSVPIRRTTTDEEGNRDVLEGRKFWDFVSWIQRVAARQGCIIPDPYKDYKLERVK